MKKICAIIPAYNAESTISKAINGISRFFKPSEIIVIDDGSSDDTYQRAKHEGAIVLKNEKNQGKGFSLKKGFKYAIKQGYNAVICLDADLQHDPADIPIFIHCYNKTDADLVLGSRIRDLSRMPLDRQFSNQTTSLIISLLTGRRVRDSQCGYRLIKTKVLKAIRLTSAKYETESELLVKALKAKYKIAHVPVKTIYNNQPSHIHRLIDTWRFIRVVMLSLLKNS